MNILKYVNGFSAARAARRSTYSGCPQELDHGEQNMNKISEVNGDSEAGEKKQLYRAQSRFVP
ncbi:hypothetical protein [Neorhizobium alkalisoli]|jgi:hypothetical protein|uniref:hypothetical protein n=1 Tax=Neorhizobium alkalisoli TaxID=528178 RepID=UPI0011A327A4|nr:hypothetical protein [Neorhizobium alkalisoli]